MKIIPVGASVILPAAQMARDMLVRFEQYAELSDNAALKKALSQKKEVNKGITMTSCAEMIKALYLDMLQDVSRWCQFTSSESHVELQWRAMINDWPDLRPSLEADLFSHVLRDAYEDIHDWTLKLDGGQPQWNVWFARRIGFDIMLERGDDYRILDWNRRMQDGLTNLEAQERGEVMSPNAWVLDDDAKRFIDLIKTEQSSNGPLSQTKSALMDDYQRITGRHRNKKKRGAL